MRTTRNEGGQAVVETVLMLPFILMVIMALAEFGFAFYSYITINNATSEAARYASVANPPDNTCADGSVEWRAVNMSRGLIDCDTIDVTYEDAGSSEPARGTGVMISVTHNYQAVTPMPALIEFVTGGTFDDNWDMTTCSDARLESRMESGTYTAGGSCGG